MTGLRYRWLLRFDPGWRGRRIYRREQRAWTRARRRVTGGTR